MIAVCLVGAWFGGKWLLAEHYAGKAIAQRDLWESYGNRIYFLEEWESALAAIARAITLNPKNAEYYRLQGHIHEWRRVAPYPEGADFSEVLSIQEQSRRDALDSYFQSLRFRPTWPVSWLKVVFLKGMLGEFDDDFYEAYRRSYSYGKNLNFVQDELTEMSVRFFAELQKVDDVAVLQMAHLGKVVQRGRQAISLLERFRVLRQACVSFEASGTELTGFAKQSCEQALAQPESVSVEADPAIPESLPARRGRE